MSEKGAVSVYGSSPCVRGWTAVGYDLVEPQAIVPVHAGWTASGYWISACVLIVPVCTGVNRSPARASVAVGSSSPCVWGWTVRRRRKHG